MSSKTYYQPPYQLVQAFTKKPEKKFECNYTNKSIDVGTKSNKPINIDATFECDTKSRPVCNLYQPTTHKWRGHTVKVFDNIKTYKPTPNGIKIAEAIPSV